MKKVRGFVMNDESIRLFKVNDNGHDAGTVAILQHSLPLLALAYDQEEERWDEIHITYFGEADSIRCEDREDFVWEATINDLIDPEQFSFGHKDKRSKH